MNAKVQLEPLAVVTESATASVLLAHSRAYAMLDMNSTLQRMPASVSSYIIIIIILTIIITN